MKKAVFFISNFLGLSKMSCIDACWSENSKADRSKDCAAACQALRLARVS